MKTKESLSSFLTLMKEQFSEDERQFISEETNFKNLKEWSSLQTMIIVNEVDKNYDVMLGIDDFKNATTMKDLFLSIQNKLA